MTASSRLVLADGLQPLAGRYDLILCDVWGVLHNGVKAYEAASDALTRFRQKGGRVVLVSNAPRPVKPEIAGEQDLPRPFGLEDAPTRLRRAG